MKVSIITATYNSEKYEISYAGISIRSKTVEDLVKNLKGIEYVIKHRHFTAVNPNYDVHREGYDSYLDELAGFSSESDYESEQS